MIVQTATPYTELQTAIYSRLTTHASTSSYDVYTAGAVPRSATFPYISIGRVSGTFQGSTTESMTDVRVEIRCNDRHEQGRVDRTAVYAMMANVTLAITSAQMSVSGDWTTWDTRPVFEELLDNLNDETHVFLSGIMRFRFRLQYTP